MHACTHMHVRTHMHVLTHRDMHAHTLIRHGYQETDEIRLDNFGKECQDAVETAKQTYISNLANKLTNLKPVKNLTGESETKL